MVKSMVSLDPRRVTSLLFILSTILLRLSADATCVPPLGSSRTIVTVAGGGKGLAIPRDIQFHPARPNELWVASADSEDKTSSGVLVIENAGTKDQRVFTVRDRVAYHYMDNIASLAFDKEGKVLFTCQESENRYADLQGPNYFQGPSAFEVWPCNQGYGKEKEGGGCENQMVSHDGLPCDPRADGTDQCFVIHSDMLHESPLCTGIAHDSRASTGPTRLDVPVQNRSRVPGNIVWYVDGVRGKLMRFDMDSLHGVKVMDHRFANIRRYVDVDITRRAGVPGHMVVDVDARHLYVADTGGKRVLRVMADSGHFVRGAMCVPDECYWNHNKRWSCGTNRSTTYDNKTHCEQFCEGKSGDDCGSATTGCRPDLCNMNCEAGWCRGGPCAMEDGLGCYTTFTETSDTFEYELWGCTDFEVFTTLLKSPSGIALSPQGRLFISDYDTGRIVVFDRAGNVLSDLSTGSAGVTGLELQCSSGQDSSCRLWFVNAISREVSYVQVDSACVEASLPPPAPAQLQLACTSPEESCWGTRNETCYAKDLVGIPGSARRVDRGQRPAFGEHMANYNERMVIFHSYGKNCSSLFARTPGLEGLGVGQNPKNWTDVDAEVCPDRLDCENINRDLLVMAGFFCHPCLPNPCSNGGTCLNTGARKGFTCSCPSPRVGDKCQHLPASCPALAQQAMGSYIPANCHRERKEIGEKCLFLCDNEFMRLTGGVRTCSQSGWEGEEGVCSCLPRRFGSKCQTSLKPIHASSAVVSSAGGKVSLRDHEWIVIPPNALPSQQTIQLEAFAVDSVPAEDRTTTGNLCSPIFELSPHRMRFLTPVTLNFTFTPPPEMSEGNQQDLHVLFFDDVTKTWMEQPGPVVQGSTISVQSDHFSRWVVSYTPAEHHELTEKSKRISAAAWVGFGFLIAFVVLSLTALGIFWRRRAQGGEGGKEAEEHKAKERSPASISNEGDVEIGDSFSPVARQ
uniref:EGF-like domain-containing protein n=1 Tax=Hanusia phi TaxID=3032 RepID=A0A7S0DX39_9CRYP